MTDKRMTRRKYLVTMLEPCSDCAGTGIVNGAACVLCSGTGSDRCEVELQAAIEAMGLMQVRTSGGKP